MTQRDRTGLGSRLPGMLQPGGALLRLGLLAAALVLSAVLLGAPGSAGATPQRMPEFTRQTPEAWLNTAPLTRADLAGQVVLIEIWTSV